MGMNDDIRLSDAATLCLHAEDQLNMKTTELNAPRTVKETQRLVHELEVHQVELEMQNADLRQSRIDVETALESYTDLYDFAPVGYFTLDRRGTIIKANLTGAAILGIERSRLNGRPFVLFVANESRPAFADFLESIYISASKVTCEVKLLKEGNSQLFAQIDSLASGSGQDCRIALRDITEQKNAEKAMIESEERHQLATSVAKEAIWEVDFLTGTTWWNRAYSEIFDRPSDEQHHGEWWLQRIHPNDRERVHDSFSRAVAEGPDLWLDDYRMMRSDGSYGYIHDRAIIARDGAGTAIRAVGAKQDYTQQAVVEESLRESEERLRFALENSHTGAWEMSLADQAA